MIDQSIVFDRELIQKYDASGPRYTSYPTAPQFHKDFTAEKLKRYIADSNAQSPQRPLSLYFHIPFCDTLCFYCACNKVITKNRAKGVDYLVHLFREIELMGELFDAQRQVVQLHWGGGTPTFLSHGQMWSLMEETRKYFNMPADDSGEFSIEVDPRALEPGETLMLLRSLGFNRLSMGVQDLDPVVQKAVNRIQSEAITFGALDDARKAGFKSVSLDLIYGLPFQSEASFAKTIERVIQARPDRMAIFNYAHLPTLFMPQRRINAADLPSPETKLAMLAQTIHQLTAAGYVYIGMDHFALPDDEMAVAQRQGTLYRNFQGYSTHAQCDLVAMGITSISQIGNSYSQNVKTLEAYDQRLTEGHLPVERGVELNADDLLRREVITRLICDFSLDFSGIEGKYGIDFRSYFGFELAQLQPMTDDGLVAVDAAGIRVLPLGRLLIRNICMVFDVYLRQAAQPVRYSKLI